MKSSLPIYIISLLSITACYPGRSFESSVSHVNRMITLRNSIERNRLRDCDTLRMLPLNTTIVVASFLKDNDYYKYYSSATDSCVIGTNLWVFMPDELLPLIAGDKAGNGSDNRRYKLLGVNEVITRDTMLLIEVNSNDLFRPAYNHRVDTLMSTDASDPLRYVREDDYVSAWFENESRYSGYPWTRKGYTYAWGDCERRGYIGVSEFVVKKGSNGKVLGYEVMGR